MRMDKDTLHEIELQIVQEQIDIAPYGGTAFFSDDEEQMNFFKGQYFAFEKMRKYMSEKYLRLSVMEKQIEELLKGQRDGKVTFAKHVKAQMATLKDHDHKLFAQIVNGLVAEGWKEDGGSYVYRLLSKDGFAIKVFRHAESPQVITICFSAEPEERGTPEPKMDKVKDV